MARPDTRHAALAAALLLAATTPALAEPSTTVRGFGTLGGVVLDDDDVAYVIGNQRDGATDEVSFETDSRIGVQFDTEITERYSGTLQVLGRHGQDGRFEPNVEWAFLRAQLDDTFGLRAGRIGAPFFNVSDFREVGYANTALRPPQDVYGQVPFRHLDGVDLSGHFAAGEAHVNAQVFFGEARIEIPADIEAAGKNLWGVNASLEVGPARLRLGYTQADVDVESPGLAELGATLVAVAQSLPVPSPALEALADDFGTDSSDANFAGIGLDLDFDPLTLSAEYTRRRDGSYIADTTGWYVMAAYRHASFTPYAYVSELAQDSATSTDAIPPAPELAALAAGVNGLLRSVGQRSVAGGLRWDFRPGFALKAQIENIEQDAVGNNFRSTDPTHAGGDDVNVYSLGVDFVF